jgi:hypothetical protein
MDILVLTAGAWPLNQKDDAGPDTNKLQIPSVVRPYSQAYTHSLTYFLFFLKKKKSSKTISHPLKVFMETNIVEDAYYGNGI